MTSVQHPPAWMDQAACASTDPEAFYPLPGVVPHDALAVCASCPVQAECLAWALAVDDRWGVLGGMTAQARHRLTRSRCSRCGGAVGGVYRWCRVCRADRGWAS